MIINTGNFQKELLEIQPYIIANHLAKSGLGKRILKERLIKEIKN